MPDFDLSSVGTVLRLQNFNENGTPKDVLALKNPSGSIIDFISWNGKNYNGIVWNFPIQQNNNNVIARTSYSGFPGAGSNPDEWQIMPISTMPPGKLHAKLVDGLSDIVYSYDYMGRLTSIGTDANPNFYVNYGYNSFGRLQLEKLAQEKITRQYEYDQQGRLKHLDDNNKYYSQDLFYENHAMIDGTFRPSGLVSKVIHDYIGQAGFSHELTMNYDRLGQLTQVNEINTLQGQQRCLVDRSYDANGNVVYSYSNALTTFKSGSGTNPTIQPIGEITYFSGTNRISTADLTTGTLSFDYDANGNVERNGQQYFSYDPWLNKVSTIDDFEANRKLYFGYNASNERLWKRNESTIISINASDLPSVETLYLHGGNPWPLVEIETVETQAQTSGSVTQTTTTTWHIYGMNGLVATHTNDKTIEFPLKDHLGEFC